MDRDPQDADRPDPASPQNSAANAALATAHAREAALRSEFQHRVRNLLAVIRSIFTRTIASGGALEDIADHFHGRLDVIGRYQRALSLDGQDMLDFETMVHDELQSVQAAADPRVSCEGPEARLPQGTALLVGLALHELVTNSIKFGTLSLPPDRGTLAIRWTIDVAGLHVAWEERGMPVLGPAPQRHGFGREYLEQALPYQLGTRTRFHIGAGAVSCLFDVPLADQIDEAEGNRIKG